MKAFPTRTVIPSVWEDDNQKTRPVLTIARSVGNGPDLGISSVLSQVCVYQRRW